MKQHRITFPICATGVAFLFGALRAPIVMMVKSERVQWTSIATMKQEFIDHESGGSDG